MILFPWTVSEGGERTVHFPNHHPPLRARKPLRADKTRQVTRVHAKEAEVEGEGEWRAMTRHGMIAERDEDDDPLDQINSRDAPMRVR